MNLSQCSIYGDELLLWVNGLNRSRGKNRGERYIYRVALWASCFEMRGFVNLHSNQEHPMTEQAWSPLRRAHDRRHDDA